MSAFEPRHCPVCGTALVSGAFDGRERMYCSDCAQHVFHLPTACAGVAVVRDSEVLLVHRTGPEYGDTWAIPGGHIEWDEEPRKAAVRELAEETGLQTRQEDITLLDATRLEGPRDEFSSINLVYVVSAVATTGSISPGEEEQDAQFWTLDRIDESEAELRPGERTLIGQALAQAR